MSLSNLSDFPSEMVVAPLLDIVFEIKAFPLCFTDPLRDCMGCGQAFVIVLNDKSIRLCILTDIDELGFDQCHAFIHTCLLGDFGSGKVSTE